MSYLKFLKPMLTLALCSISLATRSDALYVETSVYGQPFFRSEPHQTQDGEGNPNQPAWDVQQGFNDISATIKKMVEAEVKFQLRDKDKEIATLYSTIGRHETEIEKLRSNCVSRAYFEAFMQEAKNNRSYRKKSDETKTHTTTGQTIGSAPPSLSVSRQRLQKSRYKVKPAITSEPSFHEKETKTKSRRLLIASTGSSTGLNNMVGFTAHLSADVTNFGVKHTLKFDKVVTNVGNAYNRYTGTFTVPNDGLYLFAFTITSNIGNSDLSVGLMVDGVAKTHANSEPFRGGDEDQGSNVVVLSLIAGQSVWLQVSESGNHPNVFAWGGYSSFSGVLLH